MSNLIEHDREIAWPTQMLRSKVHNTPVPSVAFAEVHFVLPILAWLQKDALIKRLDAEIDAEADDPAALSHTEREKRESEVQQDLLAVERDESWLVWRAMVDERLPVEHRSDCDPCEILQVVSLVAPHSDPSPGTSWMHVIDIIGGRR